MHVSIIYGETYESLTLECKQLGIRQWLDGYVHHARNREILKRRLLDGALYKKIAAEFHLDYDYTRKLIHKEEDKLFRKIQKNR